MNKNDDISKVHFGTLALLVAGVIIIGSAGYMIIEGWNFLDAIYMVIITLATVGYKEVHTLSPAGTIFTILLIVFGVFTLYYVIRVFGEYILASRFDEDYKNRKMNNKIQSLKGHYIVCGLGRVGEKVVDELNKEEVDFVIIESDPDLVEECRERGFLSLAGDATDEEVLLQAGVMNAKGLISALGRDSDNVLTVITARTLNNNLFIVSRANTDTAVSKLLRVGANRAISPYQISAFRMATFVLHPGVGDFVDNVMDFKNSEVEISDLVVGTGSPLIGQPVDKHLANRKSGISVLIINRADGKSIINPVGNTEIKSGDRLILMGTRTNLLEVEKLFNR